MYELFAGSFPVDKSISSPGKGMPLASPHEGLGELFARFSGCSFCSGLYRILTPATAEQWEALVTDPFPNYAGRLSCFGYDWLGRGFAVDSRRREKDGAGVLMFEPGTGKALQIPCGVRGFHDDELYRDREPALSAGFHAEWIKRGGAVPNRGQCVGYKRPLFLGGGDEVENLELIDIDVYWTVMGALIRKARGLAPGAKLGKLKLIE